MDVIAMPQLGETVTEGTITAWSKQVGDPVELDDALFEVSTEKVDTEVPSAVAGFLRAILVPEGATVPIGTAVAVVTATADEEIDLGGLGGVGDQGAGDAGVPPPGGGTGSGDGAASGRGRAAGGQVSGHLARPGGSADGGGRVRTAARPAAPGAPDSGGGTTGNGAIVSPAVRRLLGEHALTSDEVAGSGRDGRITRADVLAAAAQRSAVGRAPLPARQLSEAPPSSTAPPRPAAVPAPEPDDGDEVVELSRARLATAEHMARSLATAAHALVAVEVDYHGLDGVRRSAGLSYLPFVARAVVDAIREFPHVNASFAADRLIVHRAVNLGVAVDVDREALVVPVVHGAERLRLRPLSDAVADLADRARRRRLAGEALSGGTFTLTNVGSYGTFVTAPIINQPQVAILSTDGVRMAPVAVRTDDGAPGSEKAWGIAVHPVGNLCLSFDHRAFDGAYAAAFLARVRTLLETRDWGTEVQA